MRFTVMCSPAFTALNRTSEPGTIGLSDNGDKIPNTNARSVPPVLVSMRTTPFCKTA